MKIKEYTYSNGRNDFKAIFVCEQCRKEFEAWGYADYNFYENVMPNATCKFCGKNSHGETEQETKQRLGRNYIIG